MKRRVFFTFCIFVFAYAHLFGLELRRVILATNSDATYIQFWPIVAPLWQKMGLRPTLALIADENCIVDTTIGDVIRFDPLPGVPESLQAQTIRLLLPTLFPEDGCLISDIDMLPICRSYYIEGAKKSPDDHFLIYTSNAYDETEKKYPMCYMAAKGALFQAVFEVFTPHQIQRLIQRWAELGFGWSTDETVVYSAITKWEKSGGKVMRLGYRLPERLNRLTWILQLQALDVGLYVDCHCPRPYSRYKSSIDKVVAEIEKLWERQDQAFGLRTKTG